MKILFEMPVSHGDRIVIEDVTGETQPRSRDEMASNVYRLKSDRGIVWRIKIPERIEYSPNLIDMMVGARVDGERLVVRSYHGFVYDVDWNTGHAELIKWSK